MDRTDPAEKERQPNTLGVGCYILSHVVFGLGFGGFGFRANGTKSRENCFPCYVSLVEHNKTTTQAPLVDLSTARGFSFIFVENPEKRARI